jgi:adenine phosphoribosyltransferase
LDLKPYVRDVPDFPAPGILFRDITPLLREPAAYAYALDRMTEAVRSIAPDAVAGIESRGFLFGAPIAQALGVGLGLVRKKGKLPWDTHEARYELEYGVDSVEMHKDAVTKGQRVLVVDDLIATGGTASAAVDLARQAGAEVVGATFLIELTALGGRTRLDTRCHAVLRY